VACAGVVVPWLSLWLTATHGGGRWSSAAPQRTHSTTAQRTAACVGGRRPAGRVGFSAQTQAKILCAGRNDLSELVE
jgi:hypothetical protein